MELDETVCNRAVCQHPQCWVTLRRIEQGHPRLRPPPSVSRLHPQDDGGLPALSVTTLPSNRILHDGGVMEGHRGGTPATPSVCASTASYSMEKIFFPGVNSFKEILAPSRGSGFSLSTRKLEKVKMFRPSFQDAMSRDVTMVWVPKPQHNPPKTEDREKPLKVWIKDLSLPDQLGGMNREKRNAALTTNKKKKPPTGGCPLNLTLVGSSPLPHTKNLMAAQDAQEQREEATKCWRRPQKQWPDMGSPPSPWLSGMIVENRRLVLHDAREKCPVIAHTGPVYRLDQQSAALNNTSNLEIDLDSIRNQYYLWKKYIHLAGPNRRVRPPDHRTNKTRRLFKSVAPDQLSHIGLFPCDPDSALSYYKSQALETPTGSVVCNTTRSRDSGSRNSPSLAGFSQRSWTDDEPPAAPTAMPARKRGHQETPGEKKEETQPAEPPEAGGIAAERPDHEKKDNSADKTSPDASESTADSTNVHENREQRTSSPQPNPPPPTPTPTAGAP